MKRLGMPAKPLKTVNLKGLGSRGLNTQSDSTSLGPEWLVEANNIVFDIQGRITSRKGRQQTSTIIAAPVKSIGEYIKPNRAVELYASSGAYIYKLDRTLSPTSLTAVSFGGSPQTISDSNWQWINFNNEFWGVQSGHKVINYDGTTWKDMEDLGAYVGSSGVTLFDPACALGQFGRMWYGGVTEDKGTLYYSDNLIGEKLNGGASGVVDLRTVWGDDEIVGLASLMDKIVIFGRNSIVIYKGASDPSSMTLDEVINGVGLISRDNIVSISSDLVFMGYNGLQSLSRLVATDGKAPLQDLSLAVRNDLTSIINSSSNLDNIKSTFFPADAILVTFVPDDLIAYCFDFSSTIKGELPRVTTWSFISPPLCGLGTLAGDFHLGLSNSVGIYQGYYDRNITESTSSHGTESLCVAAGDTFTYSKCWDFANVQYNYTWKSPWTDLGDPTYSKIIKSGLFTFTGGKGANSTISINKDYETGSVFSKTFSLNAGGIIYVWGNSATLFGKAIYASTDGPKEYKISLARTGKVIQLKMVTEVTGSSSSLVNTSLLTKQGKIR